MSSYYTTRWILFGRENTWGSWVTPDTFPNYLLEWSATTTENKTEEDIIAGSRDFRKRVWLEEGVVGRWTQELVSAKIFEYILGSRTSASTAPPYLNTYSPAATLPSMSIYRGMYPDDNGNTISLGYMGMKVDTAELTIEESGDVKLEVNFAGKGVTIPTAIAPSNIDMSQTAFAFHNCSISLISPGPTTTNLDLVNRQVLSIDNNLDARYSAGALSFNPVEIREGAMKVTGRLQVSGDLGLLSTITTQRRDCTLVVTLSKTGSTITATLRNISFGELPDEVTGLEPVEVEFPFTARPTSTSEPAITIVEASSSTHTLLAY